MKIKLPQLNGQLYLQLDEQLDWQNPHGIKKLHGQLCEQLYEELHWQLNGQLRNQLEDKYYER